MNKYLMMLKIADAEWDQVPATGLVFHVSSTYKVIGFKGKANRVERDDENLHPGADVEAGKALRWLQRGRPSD